jgi:predicted CoA-substrate-specific enzyme activase
MGVYVGCDVGTVSVKAAAVVIDPDIEIRTWGETVLHRLEPPLGVAGIGSSARIYLSPYRRIAGNPIDAARQLLEELTACFPEGSISSVAFTGSGARLCAERFGLSHHSGFKALATGIGMLYPEVGTILEMGGENSKFMRIETRPGEGSVGIVDYDSNGDCAAGTGSFMDQQASRLCYSIEEVGDIVVGADRGAKIAGRCSVFAKSDMIHAQQKGATPPQVLRGLCEAVARNFKGNVAKDRLLAGCTAFVGGVASNRGVFEAVREAFGAEEGEIFIPEQPAFYSALGAALLECAADAGGRGSAFSGWQQAVTETEFPRWPQLTLENVRLLAEEAKLETAAQRSAVSSDPVDAYLGVDIGSVSTNLVLMDVGGSVLHEVYLRTKARPVQVVGQGLKEIFARFGDRVTVRGVGTTGSGRELIGELIGADTINDEITAHKTGASHVAGLHLDRPVDTIFEIGGQDSKFIRLDSGVVVDFTMNEACAAGTGSFLEEQAEKLGVNIVGEFAFRALSTPAPLRLGERCTVYMEMDVTACLRKGAEKDDVIAGLAYSVAQNYLNRVVRGRPIGETIFFQGGTAYNHAVAAAFASVLGREIIVPPHNGVMGAYGAALLAKEKMQALANPSTFRGFDIDAVGYTVREFTCEACSNRCDILEFTVEGKKTYWGDKCSEKFRQQAKTQRQPVIEDLVALRGEALERDWLTTFARGESGDDLQLQAGEAARAAGKAARRLRLGMPRAMYFYHRFPFWRTYLEALGHEVAVSGSTTRQVADAGIEAAVAEPCFPIQVAHGHLKELAGMEIDRVFIPAHINEVTDDKSVQSHVCPWGQGLSAMLKHSPAAAGLEQKWLSPLVHFREGERFVEKQLWKTFGAWAAGRRHHRIAVTLGYAAQSAFGGLLQEAGSKALAALEREKENGIVVVGRPYNVYDPGMNLNLCAKLRKQYGANVIPLDFLPVDDEDLDGLNSNMYWSYGRRILRTALWTRRHPHLHVIYLTNFMCGPDSYVKTFAADGAGKPFLTLQFDGHGNDAGMMTRCEAYLDSKGLLRWWQTEE